MLVSTLNEDIFRFNLRRTDNHSTSRKVAKLHSRKSLITNHLGGPESVTPAAAGEHTQLFLQLFTVLLSLQRRLFHVPLPLMEPLGV